MVIVKTQASAHIYNSGVWEVEAEISGGKGHLWLQSKFKASLDYMELYLQKTTKKELEVQEDFEHGKKHLFGDGSWTSVTCPAVCI